MLVIIIIICNLIIVIFNLYLIGKIYKIKKNLTKMADIFVDLEANFHLFLKEYSLKFLKTALKFNKVNSKYKLWQKRNQQFQQILLIIRLGYQIYREKLS